MSVQIRLLGLVQLHRSGQIIPLGAVKRVALLAALAFNCNQPVSLEDLAAAVWVEDPPRSAVANLRNYAGALRKLIGDRITTVAGGYQLTLHAGERDVDQFRELAGRGRAALDAGDGAAAVTALTGALKLWRGPAAHGIPSGGALDAERTTLEEERLATPWSGPGYTRANTLNWSPCSVDTCNATRCANGPGATSCSPSTVAATAPRHWPPSPRRAR